MNKLNTANKVTLTGNILKEWEFSHEIYGEEFYTSALGIYRESNVMDSIPIMISNRLMDLNELQPGQSVKISGSFRSYNQHSEGKAKLCLNVFVSDIELTGLINTYINNIELDGHICKQPTYRKTPLGREISDMIIAVNRPYGKSDYIPCICWGRNANYASTLHPGDHLHVSGRIQSRVYTKVLDDDKIEERTAYEVSLNKVELVE